MVTDFNELLIISHITPWSRDIVRSRDKLKLLYLHYKNTYGDEIWRKDSFIILFASCLKLIITIYEKLPKKMYIYN